MCIIGIFTLSSYMVMVIAVTMNAKNFVYTGDRMTNFDSSTNRRNAVQRDEYVESLKLSDVGKKSWKKCEEYGRKIVWILPLMNSRPIPITINCPTSSINPLITGGENAKAGEFPHMAAIGWVDIRDRRTIVYNCGGSLVSDLWVLTAAHCTHDATMGNPVVVRLGAVRLTDESSGRTFRIVAIERHPAYVPPSMYADLALLKLSDAVSFTTEIKPACLDAEFGRLPTRAWITGWGSKQRDGEKSDALLKANVDIVDNVRCSSFINFTTSVPNGVVPSMLCAADLRGGWNKDTCKGDSGGPIQVLNPNGCLYNLIGVTSFGKLCAAPNYPGVYIRVSHYLEWIESVVWPEDDKNRKFYCRLSFITEDHSAEHQRWYARKKRSAISTDE